MEFLSVAIDSSRPHPRLNHMYATMGVTYLHQYLCLLDNATSLSQNYQELSEKMDIAQAVYEDAEVYLYAALHEVSLDEATFLAFQ